MTPKVLRTPAALGAPPHVRVTNLELFFDLVYVFAITQLSQFLYDNQTPRGALEALILFSAVWWAWSYTAWATNWIDPDQPATALVMIVLMALGLFMAAALPEAFGGRGAPFAIAYVALQLARTGFVAAAFPAGDPMRANNLRLLAWLSLGGAIWILGAYLHGDARLIVWLVAVALELSAPWHGFRLPGGPAIPIERWRLSGTHLAERYQLVLMIALGESVLRVGLTASDNPGSVTRDTAFIVGFLLSAALWAAYFLRLAEAGAERVATASEGRAARVGRGYSYAHAAMVAGVIVVAVAVQSAIHVPESPATLASTLVVLGGPALFLAGLSAYQRSARLGAAGRPLVAIGVLALLVLPALAGADQLVLVICVTGVLLALAAWLTLAPLRSRAG